jgi:hypothetical protein
MLIKDKIMTYVHKTSNGWLSGFTPCGLDKMENRSLDVTTDGKKVTCPLCLKTADAVSKKLERTDK